MGSSLFFENPAAILQNFVKPGKSPVYIQYYTTAKCNLKCQQCNIIYSNPGHKEMDLAQIEKVAENLKKIGNAIVLLTGGEPFARKDLPEIVLAFAKKGIHVRIQTNGFADVERLKRCVENGARDISISLDSLNPAKQDYINGEKKDSWDAAMRAVALVTQVFPKKNSFASFGCVITPFNIPDILDVIEFASRVSWYVSLVPIHVNKPPDHPQYEGRLFAQNFRPDLLFTGEQKKEVASLLTRLKQMKREGAPLYDSDVYLDDIVHFISGQPLVWRSKNDGACDAPYLYFAIRPNGDMATCCEYNIKDQLPAYHPDFPKWYRDPVMIKRYVDVAKACSGCMYGSYPEITTAIRFLPVALERARIFTRTLKAKKWPFAYDDLITIAREIIGKKEAVSLVA